MDSFKILGRICHWRQGFLVNFIKSVGSGFLRFFASCNYGGCGAVLPISFWAPLGSHQDEC